MALAAKIIVGIALGAGSAVGAVVIGRCIDSQDLDEVIDLTDGPVVDVSSVDFDAFLAEHPELVA